MGGGGEPCNVCSAFTELLGVCVCVCVCVCVRVCVRTVAEGLFFVGVVSCEYSRLEGNHVILAFKILEVMTLIIKTAAVLGAFGNQRECYPGCDRRKQRRS